MVVLSAGAADLRDTGDAMTTILLDADIVAYKVSVLNQDDFDWGDTGKSRVVDPIAAKKQTDDLIAEYCDTLNASKAIICLSEPDPEKNFRRQLNPSYKHNRKDVELPELLMWVKEYLAYEYQSFKRPRLEADDIMGILATSGDRFIKGDRIIVSEDKDMRTVPAKVYNPNKPDLGVLDISELDANRFHMWQTLVGDTTDGYPGCPGIGPGGEYIDGEFVEGARSFSFAHDLLSARQKDLWDIVLAAYASKGRTEEDAILQARMAHILWASSYNFKTKKVRLWQPFWLL